MRAKPEIKELMEGVLKTMVDNEKMWGRFYNKEEEEASLKRAIIKEEREEVKKEMVLNMKKKGLSLELISECSNLSLEEVEQIIKENK